MLNTTVTVGSGKAIHWGTDCGTMCGAAHRNGFFTAPKLVKAEAVTCKRCLKAMAARIEADHAEAIAMDEERSIYRAANNVPTSVVVEVAVERAHGQAAASADVQAGTQWIATDGKPSVQVTRVGSFAGPRVTFCRADGNTGTLLLDWFLVRYTPAPSPEDAHLVALHTEAVRTQFAAPDAENADGAVKLLAMLAAPEAHGEVPNTVEAWKAYAERVKTSRDAAEAEVARLLRVLAAGAQPSRTAKHVAYRLRDIRTGATYLVHGTSPSANAPHLTTVWVQREGEQGVRGWSLDTLCSAWHDLVAV